MRDLGEVGLRIVWAAVVALAVSRGALAAEPPIEGDARLFNLVRDGQAANLARLTKGEFVATYRSDSGTTDWGQTINIRIVWSGEKAYWEYDLWSKAPKGKEAEAPRLPHVGRVVFDGQEYVFYVVSLDSFPGQVVIFPANEPGGTVPVLHVLELLPAAYWARCNGSRPWVELLGPHPKFPSENILKWVVRQQGRDRVVIERHDKSDEHGNTGLARFVCSLELAGNVIEDSYEGHGQTSRGQYTWAKDCQGRVLLRRVWIKFTNPRIRHEKELVITRCDPDAMIAPDQFTIQTLRIKRGSSVEDRVRKRNFTFGGRRIDQQALDELGRELRSRGLAAPGDKN